MKLATIRTAKSTRAVRIDSDAAVELDADDVGELLGRPDWKSYAQQADGPRRELTDLDYATLIPRPEKIICVGLNYRTHIVEMGRELPTAPTLFAKFSRALIGAFDDVVLPLASRAVDWEAELGVVMGATVRHADDEQARAAIAGFTIVNDVTERDWQNRTPQWLQGKTFEATTPVGPWLVTDLGHEPALRLVGQVNGTVVQEADTSDLVFGPVALIKYISQIITLVPGDIIATGTPGGVGHARIPQQYLVDGDVLATSIESIGEISSRCRSEKR